MNQLVSNPNFWLFLSSVTALIVAVTSYVNSKVTSTKADHNSTQISNTQQQLNGSLDTRIATTVVAAMGLAQANGRIPTPSELTHGGTAPTVPSTTTSTTTSVTTQTPPPLNVPPIAPVTGA